MLQKILSKPIQIINFEQKCCPIIIKTLSKTIPNSLENATCSKFAKYTRINSVSMVRLTVRISIKKQC